MAGSGTTTGLGGQEQQFESLLDLEGAAGVLGIHTKTLEAMARNRQIPAMKLGRRWKFRLSALDEWLDSKLHSTPQPGMSR